MQRTDEISARDLALAAVKMNASALNQVKPKLKDDISFAWAISRIQSDNADDSRKKYINRFFIQESLKLFVSCATVVMSSLLIAGAFLFPLIVGSLLASFSGLYTLNKLYQHIHGFFKAFIIKESNSTNVMETQIQGVDRLSSLPREIAQETAKHLSEADRVNLGSGSRGMRSMYQEKPLLDKFLQRVAYGMQDKVEQIFTLVYRDNAAKIQEALRYQGQFTDYSGRTFNCSAYEYAYWAKDTHMRRMLERYMDEETKAIILARITTNAEIGLSYQQNGAEHRTPHFDLTPLKEAYQRYLSNFNAWYAANKWRAIAAAWLAVGLAQRDVPVHVAQEYCRPDRSFHPCPEFNEASLPRVLTFTNWETPRGGFWFPLPGPSSGLGYDFSFFRGPDREELAACDGAWARKWSNGPRFDAAAITRLDEVRTAQLTQSREYLQSPTASHRFSR